MLLKFDVYRNGRLWRAREIGHAIFPQASTLNQLYSNVKDATHLHHDEEFDNREKLEILPIPIIDAVKCRYRTLARELFQ